MKSKDELLELILNDSNAFNEYICDNADNGIDMSEVDLSNSEIRDITFKNIDFTSSTNGLDNFPSLSNLIDLSF